MARLFYAAIPEKLPDAGDVRGMAEYWKKFYNTRFGSGTTEEFVTNYARYVGHLLCET
jgi:hypothetical protein